MVIAASAVITVYYIDVLLHYRKNKKAVPKSGFIMNQGGDTGKIRYGFFRTSYNGCGWIAVYNAARLMGENPRAERIISYLESWGLLIFGVFGTFPLAAAAYFLHMGHRVKITFDPKKYDIAAKKSAANIVWYFHSRGAHFVTVGWDGENFIGYNTYSNSTAPDVWGKSISENLRRRKKKPVLLISVS